MSRTEPEFIKNGHLLEIIIKCAKKPYRNYGSQMLQGVLR